MVRTTLDPEGSSPEKALPGICAEKEGKMVRSSASPSGRPISVLIFCLQLPRLHVGALLPVPVALGERLRQQRAARARSKPQASDLQCLSAQLQAHIAQSF